MLGFPITLTTCALTHCKIDTGMLEFINTGHFRLLTATITMSRKITNFFAREATTPSTSRGQTSQPLSSTSREAKTQPLPSTSPTGCEQWQHHSQSTPVSSSVPGVILPRVPQPCASATASIGLHTKPATMDCVGKMQFIPSSSFPFPREANGRGCRAEWFLSFPWLHYDVATNSTACWTCLQAVAQKGIDLPKETAFLTGFRNWKRATELMKGHSESTSHNTAVRFSAAVNQKSDVSRLLNKENARQQDVAYSALIAILKSIRFLGRQGLALRVTSIMMGTFGSS